MTGAVMESGIESPRDEALLNIVTGMLSTLGFNPSQDHPQACRVMATAVVRQVRLWDAPEATQPSMGDR